MAPIKRQHKAIGHAILSSPLELLPRGHLVALMILAACLVVSISLPDTVSSSSATNNTEYELIPLPNLDAAFSAADIIPQPQSSIASHISPLTSADRSALPGSAEAFTVPFMLCSG